MRGYGARNNSVLHAGLFRSHIKNKKLLAIVDQCAKFVDADTVITLQECGIDARRHDPSRSEIPLPPLFIERIINGSPRTGIS
jgi:hypothetical protein